MIPMPWLLLVLCGLGVAVPLWLDGKSPVDSRATAAAVPVSASTGYPSVANPPRASTMPTKLAERLYDDRPPITPPPGRIKADPYYSKHLDARGVSILAHATVQDEALWRMREIILMMLERREDVARALFGKLRVLILPSAERISNLPEHADIDRRHPGTNWDYRTRGLGPTRTRPYAVCPEDNLLQYQGSRQFGRSTCLHEFAHAIHLMGLAALDPAFNEKLAGLYGRAMSNEIIRKTYAGTNPAEYYAVSVEAWYSLNRCRKIPDGINGPVCTHDMLKRHDPEMYALLSEHYNPPDDRTALVLRRK